MAQSFATVSLMGHLGGDAERHHTRDGRPLVAFSVAVATRRRVAHTDQWSDETNWYRVAFSGPRAEGISKYLTRGKAVVVIGRLTADMWVPDDRSPRLNLNVFANEVHIADRAEQRDDDDPLPWQSPWADDNLDGAADA